MPNSPSAGDVVLGARVALGRRYIELVADPPWDAWLVGYEQYTAARLDLPSSLLLVHPMWLADESRRESVYGGRRFERLRDPALYRCHAEAVWGYQCKAQHQAFQLDHRFPYAFGGPTEAANRLPLCSAHNATKSSDVHLYSWEEGEPRWLGPLLRRLRPWT
jgi:hypothetical protein